MERLDALLRGEAPSHILPFLWMKGEDNETIREELVKIEECGIREICLESRPHPDFCGPGWWENLDFILPEARKRGMRVWILDDDKFPTGQRRIYQEPGEEKGISGGTPYGYLRSLPQRSSAGGKLSAA